MNISGSYVGSIAVLVTYVHMSIATQHMHEHNDTTIFVHAPCAHITMIIAVHMLHARMGKCEQARVRTVRAQVATLVTR